MILINSAGIKTVVREVNGQPDFTDFSESTIAILQAAYDAGDYEVILDPEPINESPQPNWLQFYKSLKISLTFGYLMDLTVIAPNISGVMAAMGIAIQDGIRDPLDPDIFPAFQASVSGVIAALNAIGQPLTVEQLAEVRLLLDNNGFNFIQLQ